MIRLWAFSRRIQYGVGFGLFWVCVFTFVYFQYFYTQPTCFDNTQNGEERGVDCGGACTRICTFDVFAPDIKWARSFKANDNQYNAVAYLENKNRVAAAPEVKYTFSLYDERGLITQRSGKTVLPPDSVYPVFEGRIDTQGRIPTQTFIELEDVSVWLPAEAGSEQFTITDRQLFNADASPRLEAKLLNNSLQPAKQVEIVATIFDARGNALTASRTFVDNFQGRSEESVTFTWPLPIAKTIRSCEVPTDIVLAVDLSGSMNNDQEAPPEPITSVLASAKAFVSRLQNEDQAGLVTFATEAKIEHPLTRDLASVADTVSELTIDPEEETGSTNTGDALVQAMNELVSERHSVEARKVLVLLTDGLATAPDEEPEAYALVKAQEVKNSDITVYTIGLGENVNMDFVTSLASTPAHAYKALTTADVNRIYQTITGEICEDGAAVIQIVPKTNATFQSLR